MRLPPPTFEDKCKIPMLADESEVPSCDFALKTYPDEINQDIYPDDFYPGDCEQLEPEEKSKFTPRDKPARF